VENVVKKGKRIRGDILTETKLNFKNKNGNPW
jgi:hypothetical protein